MELENLQTLRTGDNLASIGSNVNTGYRLVMSFQLISQLKLPTRPLIQVHSAFTRNSEGLTVSRKRVIRNGMVEEVMNFRRSHGE